MVGTILQDGMTPEQKEIVDLKISRNRDNHKVFVSKMLGCFCGMIGLFFLKTGGLDEIKLLPVAATGAGIFVLGLMGKGDKKEPQLDPFTLSASGVATMVMLGAAMEYFHTPLPQEFSAAATKTLEVDCVAYPQTTLNVDGNALVVPLPPGCQLQ